MWEFRFYSKSKEGCYELLSLSNLCFHFLVEGDNIQAYVRGKLNGEKGKNIETPYLKRSSARYKVALLLLARFSVILRFHRKKKKEEEEEEEEEDGFDGRRLGRVLATEAARQEPSRTSRCSHDCWSAHSGFDKFQTRELSVGTDANESSCGGPGCNSCAYGWHCLLLWRKSLEITLKHEKFSLSYLMIFLYQ
ncbi:uncharacterized protein LOC130138874 [Syzygium oleosum]|uniref:uncharacterized protein LOC130138874 n=1 Tax=Syzygium oleosum TaxID=219896 RepID=UPI0024BBDCF3|nr:uncharacterized protein LOC130138874 [Syzygium oleosum]